MFNSSLKLIVEIKTQTLVRISPDAWEIGRLGEERNSERCINSIKNIMQPSNYPILSLRLSGRSENCACCMDCGGRPSSLEIEPIFAVPLEASPYVTKDEVNQLIDRVNETIARNHLPFCPFTLLHILLPYSPLCIAAYYASRRQKKLREIVGDANAFLKDCHW